MGPEEKLEYKLGFDRIRNMISDRCSTEYAVGRVAGEKFCTDKKEIEKRLLGSAGRGWLALAGGRLGSRGSWPGRK